MAGGSRPGRRGLPGGRLAVLAGRGGAGGRRADHAGGQGDLHQGVDREAGGRGAARDGLATIPPLRGGVEPWLLHGRRHPRGLQGREPARDAPGQADRPRLPGPRPASDRHQRHPRRSRGLAAAGASRRLGSPRARRQAQLGARPGRPVLRHAARIPRALVPAPRDGDAPASRGGRAAR